MASSKAERVMLLSPSEEDVGGATTTGAAEVVEAIWGAQSLYHDGGEGAEGWGGRGSSSGSKWNLARVAGNAVTATLAIASIIVLLNTSWWQYANGANSLATPLGGVALEVEPVGHVIWLGSKLPNVKRVFLHRNQELLHEAGWKLKLW